MQSQDSNLDQDRLIESFQQRWRAESAGADVVAEFVRLNELRAPTHAETIVELIEMDIELAWHCWARFVEREGVSRTPEQLREKMGALPTLSDYASLLDELGCGDRARGEIARYEYEVREAFGDAIPAAHYLESFGIQLRIPSETSNRYVRPEGRGGSNRLRTAKLPLRGRSILGRQRSQDPSDLQMEGNSEGMRIIVAHRSETRVSREHVAVQLLTPSAAIVENLSGRNAVLLADGKALQPNEMLLQLFPFTLQFPHQRFRLE